MTPKTPGLFSLSSLSLSASYTDSVTRHKQMFSHCVPMFFSLSPFFLLQCSFATAGVHTLFTPLHSSQPCKLSPPGHLTSAQVSPCDAHKHTHTSLEDCPPLALIVRCPTPIPDHHPQIPNPPKENPHCAHICTVFRSATHAHPKDHHGSQVTSSLSRSSSTRLTGAIASRDDHHHHFRALAAQTRPPERTAAAGSPPSRPSPKSRRACRQGCC